MVRVRVNIIFLPARPLIFFEAGAPRGVCGLHVRVTGSLLICNVWIHILVRGETSQVHWKEKLCVHIFLPSCTDPEAVPIFVVCDKLFKVAYFSFFPDLNHGNKRSYSYCKMLIILVFMYTLYVHKFQGIQFISFIEKMSLSWRVEWNTLSWNPVEYAWNT